MVIFIIIIAVAVFLWWSLVPSQKSISQNPEQRFNTYVLNVMMNTVEYNSKEAPIKELQGTFVMGGLLGCKEHLEKNSYKLAQQYGLPEPRVKTIIQNNYKHMMDTYIKL